MLVNFKKIQKRRPRPGCYMYWQCTILPSFFFVNAIVRLPFVKIEWHLKNVPQQIASRKRRYIKLPVEYLGLKIWVEVV